MTVVVGYTNGRTWGIGADSGAYEDTGLYQLTAEAKCWQAGDAFVGVSGSFRAMEVARRSKLGDPYALRNALLEANVGNDWNVLIVTRKALYEVDDSFSVIKLKGNYGAIGIANGVALGALAIAAKWSFDTEEAVRLALAACGTHSTYVAPPYTKLFQSVAKEQP